MTDKMTERKETLLEMFDRWDKEDRAIEEERDRLKAELKRKDELLAKIGMVCTTHGYPVNAPKPSKKPKEV